MGCVLLIIYLFDALKAFLGYLRTKALLMKLIQHNLINNKGTKSNKSNKSSNNHLLLESIKILQN